MRHGRVGNSEPPGSFIGGIRSVLSSGVFKVGGTGAAIFYHLFRQTWSSASPSLVIAGLISSKNRFASPG